MKLSARIAATFNRSGAARNDVVGAAAMPAVSRDAEGSGAPSSRRAQSLLAVLAVATAALFASAAPASASTAEMGTVSQVSYASAHVTGKVSTTWFAASNYAFQYSTDEGVSWTTGFTEEFFGAQTDLPVEGKISVPKGGTRYLVRLKMIPGFLDPESTSPEAPGPYPEFTTLPVDPPTIPGTVAASPVFSTSASANATVKRPANEDPAFDVNCHFEYITDAQYNVEQSEVQELTVAATGGSFQLEFEGQKTSQIPFDASAATVENALNTLPIIGFTSGSIAVSGGPGDENASSPYVISFGLELANQNVPLIRSDGDQLEGNTTAINVSTSTKGRAIGFEGATVRSCAGPGSAENPIGPADAGTDKTVTAPLGCTNPLTDSPESCLEPETTYHLRLVAENAAPGVVTKDAAGTFTTEPKVAPPTIIATDDASEVGQNTAKASGEIQRPAGADPALDTSCRFEYVTDDQFTSNPPGEEFAGGGQVACVEAPPEAPLTTTDPTPVSAALGGLKPATTYHLRLVAENGGGVDAEEAAGTFTTIPAELPTVTIDPVAGGTYTTAHVSGTVDIDDPGHSGANPYIEISTDGGATWPGGFSGERPGVSGPGPHVVEKNFTGLQPNTTYTFRIKANYDGVNPDVAEANGEMAFSPEPNPEITTGELFPPTAEDLEVTGATATTAHFSATVDPHAPAGPLSPLAKKAFATHWEFVCTPECKDANGNPIEGTVEGEEGSQPVFGDAKRLDPNMCYETSLVIHSEGGDETLGPIVFCTPLIKPTVKASPGGSDGKGGYILAGIVNPNGSEVSEANCKFAWGPDSGEELKDYAFQATCSPTPGAGAKPLTVEAPLTGLTPGATYHFRLFATNAAGTEKTEDQIFVPTPAAKESCPANEQQRIENNSLALPECRAYEMVSPPGKEGWPAQLVDHSGDDTVSYESGAGNIAKSGQNNLSAKNFYVATRSASGWETIPNLNGSSGSFFDAPSEVETRPESPRIYSQDLLSSIWNIHRRGGPSGNNYYLRNPDGLFTLIGAGDPADSAGHFAGASDDLSHVFLTSTFYRQTPYGPGVYEFVGTDNEQPPRRADVDNAGSPITTCTYPGQQPGGDYNARAAFNSRDGRVFVFRVAGGCGAANPPTSEIWARVNGTTSFDVSASHCHRTAADPGGECNPPVGSGACSFSEIAEEEVGPGCRGAKFQGAAADGSRVFFTTSRQLVDGDTDQTEDIYACDIPSGVPAPIDEANPCSAFRQVSAGAPTGALVESVGAVSANGATVLFTAKGVLAGNDDALGEKALAGDHNLYAWRADAAHPDGLTVFLARLDSNDIDAAQATPDGRYLVFTTANPLVETDTDHARDVYRVDADTGALTRASTNVFGVAGNGEDSNAVAPSDSALSDDGQKIVFTSAEALSPADGNGEADVYLWTPTRVSLISTGSSGYPLKDNLGTLLSPRVSVTGSGHDIYFSSAQPLTPADGDDSADVYDARVGGGFNFPQAAPCSGEACQPPPAGSPAVPAPGTDQPLADPGNVKSKACPKGKVLKGNKCVKKKKSKKHSGKKHHGKKAAHKRGGGK